MNNFGPKTLHNCLLIRIKVTGFVIHLKKPFDRIFMDVNYINNYIFKILTSATIILSRITYIDISIVHYNIQSI